jgi:hypothetical protein
MSSFDDVFRSAKMRRHKTPEIGLRAADISSFDMSYLLVKIAKIVLSFGRSRPEYPRPPVLGDWQREQDRRSALWVLGIIISLFLLGWLLLK